MQRRHYLRALGVGVATMVSALMIYDRPPEWAAYWQPFLQGVSSALASLGMTMGTPGAGAAPKPPATDTRNVLDQTLRG